MRINVPIKLFFLCVISIPVFCKRFIKNSIEIFKDQFRRNHWFKFVPIHHELSKLSVSGQIILFNQADIIVSSQGTGLANSIFCNSNTKIIELFQSLGDCTFWYISQIFNLNYIPMKTVDFEHDFFKAWKSDTAMPLRVIEDIKKYF